MHDGLGRCGHAGGGPRVGAAARWPGSSKQHPNGVEVVEKRASEHKAMADKKRKDEIDFLKYQGQHLDQFLRQLGPAAK